MKKYELTSNFKMHFGRKLFQIRALISFGSVKAGELAKLRIPAGEEDEE